MEKAMSGLDSFHFLVSDKYKRITTQNCAMRSSSRRVKFGIATMTLVFTFFCPQLGKMLPKHIISMISCSDLERILTCFHRRWEAAHKPCTHQHLSFINFSERSLIFTHLPFHIFLFPGTLKAPTILPITHLISIPL